MLKYVESDAKKKVEDRLLEFEPDDFEKETKEIFGVDKGDY